MKTMQEGHLMSDRGVFVAEEYLGGVMEGKSLVATSSGLSRMVMALDPGPVQTGWCVYDLGEVLDSGVMPNERMLEIVALQATVESCTLAIEMIASYGMAVGREVFETCVWIGRFQQAWHQPEKVAKVYRKDVKLHLCGTTKAKDSNIRQALIDLFAATGGGKTPQIGTKAQPGPLYGISSHAWPALAVAITWSAKTGVFSK